MENTCSVSVRITGEKTALKKLKRELADSYFTESGFLMVRFSVNGKGFMELPSCIHNTYHTTSLFLEENGGGNCQGGYGQIVCGTEGEAITPFFIKKSTACFLVREEAVLISAKNNGGSDIAVKIERFDRIEEKDGIVYGNKSLVFEGCCNKKWFEDDFPETGNLNELLSIPYYVLFFYFATREAIRKSRCNNCKRPHYVKVTPKTTRPLVNFPRFSNEN